MSGWKKLAAAPAGGGGLNVEELFSTYLYDGNSGAQTFVNGLDLAGEGGLVWSKRRNGATSHVLIDTARSPSGADGGVSRVLNTAYPFAEGFGGYNFVYNSNGYSLNTTSAEINDTPNRTYCSWSFRKAPKFFDVVTYDGNSTAGREIAHSLGTTVGTIIVKCRNASSTPWKIFHRSLGSSKFLEFDTGPQGDAGTHLWYGTEPTDTVFTLGADSDVNYTGRTYVAYLFAHNDGDGGFGPDGDKDIIKCGIYTGNGDSTASGGPFIDLGFEPQFVIIKRANSSSNWSMFDTMRGMEGNGEGYRRLQPNRDNEEDYGTTQGISPEATGFRVRFSGTDYNASGGTYIYIAIRRGQMAVPESAADVFDIAVAAGTTPSLLSDFPVDFAFERTVNAEHDWNVGNRLTGQNYLTLNTFRDDDSISTFKWDYQNGWSSFVNNGTQSWMWRRAFGYFDTVVYYADGVQGRAINHNLGVVPEMMWVKKKTGNQDWYVYHKDLGNTKYISLNTNTAPTTNTLLWDSTTPDDTTFTVGNVTNNASQSYVCMLFATVSGISKVGGWTGNGASSRTIDCGFSNGARFVFVRDVSASGTHQWWTVDTQRGFGNIMFLNDGQAEQAISLFSSNSAGFTVSSFFNASGTNYIFYAVA
jgi:hypothetical protein